MTAPAPLSGSPHLRPDAPPLISLAGISRAYPLGDEQVTVLRDVTLTIEAGEFVAIMGSSGSGKSTLMNILGCLDSATAGQYLFNGVDVSTLEVDELAALRRENFGFIFQRYHLLDGLDALANVEVPASYAGVGRRQRRARAADLLTRLGLSDRLHHRPSQLSGGQQQRVSVARALMNGGDVILADEPTGALDSKSGDDMMALLAELNRAGQTIIVVTHSAAVAGHAHRIIELRDGQVVADTRRPVPGGDVPSSATSDVSDDRRNGAANAVSMLARIGDAFRMAVRSILVHRLRSFLTMLGIVIGIASVVIVVAVGQTMMAQVLNQISGLGTNTITVMPGRGFGDMGGGYKPLTVGDAEVLAMQPFADSVTPLLSVGGTVRHGTRSTDGQALGVGPAQFQVYGQKFTAGRGFTTRDVVRRTPVAVLNARAVSLLFPDGEMPLGKNVLLNGVSLRVIGVLAEPTFSSVNVSNAELYIPYTTVMDRFKAGRNFGEITIRIADGADISLSVQMVEAILDRRHGARDFFIWNKAEVRAFVLAATVALTAGVSLVALIALVVGGIGVMNIMLVSVTERTAEIGVRMAVGARRSDVLSQFLIEALLVCLVGGAFGVALAFGVGGIAAVAGFPLAFSGMSIVVALAASTATGLVFGFFPARRAAGLRPVAALARE